MPCRSSSLPPTLHCEYIEACIFRRDNTNLLDDLPQDRRLVDPRENLVFLYGQHYVHDEPLVCNEKRCNSTK